jgi:hypothetical protein
MATKITTALVAALVVGALMTPNHEVLARGGGGFGGGWFHGGGFGGGGFPTFMAGMGMAAVRITTAPTNAIEQHGALLQMAGGRGGAHPHGARRGIVVIAAGLPQTPVGVYEGVLNMTRIGYSSRCPS